MVSWYNLTPELFFILQNFFHIKQMVIINYIHDWYCAISFGKVVSAWRKMAIFSHGGYINREVSRLYEYDNDNEHVINSFSSNQMVYM
jgi:hypothetical protein